MTSQPRFYIDTIPVYGKAILSPMDGFSDWPFRSLCRETGSALSYTEFINVREVLTDGRYAQDKMRYDESERPVVFQIYGEEPDEMLAAALKLQALKPDILDINLGCPSRSIARRGAGVGLMRTPLKVARIFRKLSTRLDIPVTGKIRLGWQDCRNYALIARIIEENGGQALALHARTKEQGYGGQAQWEAIAEVKSLLHIPVIGNGDIKQPEDIDRMLQMTGCDAVMIGRAAIGNPWIFSGRARAEISKAEVRAFVREHLQRNLHFYGPELGLRLFRKHAVQYIAPYAPPRALRTRLLQAQSPDLLLDLLDQILSPGT